MIFLLADSPNTIRKGQNEMLNPKSDASETYETFFFIRHNSFYLLVVYLHETQASTD